MPDGWLRVGTVDLVGRGADDVFIAEGLGAGADADAADARDDLLEHALVVGELATQVVDQLVDELELGLVASRGQAPDDWAVRGEAGHGD